MNINILNVTKHEMAKEIFAVVFTQWLCSRRMSINYSPVAPYYIQAFITSHIPSWEQLQRPALAQQQGLSGAMNCGSTLLNMHVHMHTLISRYGICQYEPTMLDYQIYGEYGKEWKEGRWWQDVGMVPTAVGVGWYYPIRQISDQLHVFSYSILVRVWMRDTEHESV